MHIFYCFSIYKYLYLNIKDKKYLNINLIEADLTQPNFKHHIEIVSTLV